MKMIDSSAYAGLPPHFGCVVDDVLLSQFAQDDAPGLQRLIATCGVVVFRGQTLDDAGFVRALEALGPMTFTPGETPLADQPNLNAVSNVGRTSPPRSVFHTDSSYFVAPPAFTALRAVRVPHAGGATLFSDQYRAADTLPASLRARVAGRTMRHCVTGLAGRFESCRHPILRRHPISQRVALYISTPERCDAVDGLAGPDSRALIDALYEHSIAADHLFRHDWSAGDVVIWDDRCTLHRGDHSATVGDRVLHRGMVAGEIPIAA